MKTVFISSIQSGFGDERAAAKAAVDAAGMHPVMAESVGAAAASPQRALLDRVRDSDIYVLLIGPRYSGPTDEEFQEAVRQNKPVLVFVTTDPMDADSVAFRDRATDGWEEGRLRGTFANPHELSLAIVKGLQSLSSRPSHEQALASAVERANALAESAAGRSGFVSAEVAVILAPAGTPSLLDAVALGDSTFSDSIATIARDSGLAPNADGLLARASREGVEVSRTSTYSGGSPLVTVHTDGSVVAWVDVSGDGGFASSIIDAGKLRTALLTVGTFARSTWSRVDNRNEVDYLAAVLAVPGAGHRVFGKSPSGNSISIGGAMSLPNTVVAPRPPLVVRQNQLAGDDAISRLVAELRLVYAEVGALSEE